MKLRKVEFINNYKYKGHWNNWMDLKYNKDWCNVNHLIIGVLRFFIFITWR